MAEHMEAIRSMENHLDLIAEAMRNPPTAEDQKSMVHDMLRECSENRKQLEDICMIVIDQENGEATFHRITRELDRLENIQEQYRTWSAATMIGANSAGGASRSIMLSPASTSPCGVSAMPPVGSGGLVASFSRPDSACGAGHNSPGPSSHALSSDGGAVCFDTGMDTSLRSRVGRANSAGTPSDTSRREKRPKEKKEKKHWGGPSSGASAPGDDFGFLSSAGLAASASVGFGHAGAAASDSGWPQAAGTDSGWPVDADTSAGAGGVSAWGIAGSDAGWPGGASDAVHSGWGTAAATPQPQARGADALASGMSGTSIGAFADGRGRQRAALHIRCPYVDIEHDLDGFSAQFVRAAAQATGVPHRRIRVTSVRPGPVV